MNDEIEKRVKDIATINFNVSKCPVKIYEEFVALCKEQTGDNYAFGIKLGIDAYKLQGELVEMKTRLARLEVELTEMKNGPKKEESKAKTFGTKR